jgi:Type I restriction modification DNA specificity domain
MKTTRLDLPVMASWMESNGRRLDCNPYLSGGFEARVLLERLNAEKQPLKEVTQGGMKGIFNGPRFSRHYVNDPKHGVPFLGSTDILAADLSGLSMISKKQVKAHPELLIDEGWTLITCSGTIGRMVFSRADMKGMTGSQHFMRIIADRTKIPPGYLYAYLSSRFGVSLIASGTYGSIIQHLEPNHIADLPVPRLGDSIESEVHNLMVEAARLRTEYQTQVRSATHQLFASVGLKDITAAEWHEMESTLGFTHILNSASSMRALNFNPRFQNISQSLSSVNHLKLGDICAGGELRSGVRFKRIDCEPQLGSKLIGQKEIFWFEPEGRWISTNQAPTDIFVQDETILIAAQGTLGENEVFCRSELITGEWLDYVYSQHFIRVRSGNPDVSGAFLFAFFRSETAFRCLRSMSTGSKQQDIHRAILSNFPIPIPSQNERNEIEILVRQAFQSRHHASILERQATAIVESNINSA